MNTETDTYTSAAELDEARRVHEAVATLAYELWQTRGCPDGSPEEDWFAAEAELNGHAANL